MIGPLLAYILIWLGLFTLFCAAILWLGPRTQVRLIKALASRLSPEAATPPGPPTPPVPPGPPGPPDALPPMEVFARLGVIFLTLGPLLLLLMAPGAEADGMTRWRLVLVEALLAVVVVWQVIALRGKATSRPTGRP